MLDGLDVAHGRSKTGRRVVIVGGGKLGLTLAESLRKHQEAEVTVVESGKRIAGDVKPSFKWRHASWVEELGITCLTSSSLIEVDCRRRQGEKREGRGDLRRGGHRRSGRRRHAGSPAVS